MQNYLDLLQDIIDNGNYREDRTGVGTLSVFGRSLRFNLNVSFPLMTTKKIHTKSVFGELLWFLSGDTNTQWLKDNNITIWDEWADEHGDLGPVYGAQWRSWPSKDGGTIDQISRVIESIKNDPYSRRHIVSAWNVSDLDDMALQPCHILFQFYVANGKLSCQLYQRSADVFLGLPFNIASYALLTNMVAQQTGLRAGELIITIGDAHLYVNHWNQAKEQLNRLPDFLPSLVLNPRESIFDYTLDDITVVGYHPMSAIPAPVAV